MRLHPVPLVPVDAAPNADSGPKKATQVSIDIYRSSTDRSKYLSVLSGVDLSAMTFSANLDQDLFNVGIYKENVLLEQGKPAVGLNVESILNQIKESGFAIHGLEFSASMSIGVSASR
jgi:uncharacterized protein YcgL (UPF0745 family)